MLIYAADDEKLMLEALTDAITEVIPQADIQKFRRGKDVIAAAEKDALRHCIFGC